MYKTNEKKEKKNTSSELNVDKILSRKISIAGKSSQVKIVPFILDSGEKREILTHGNIESIKEEIPIETHQAWSTSSKKSYNQTVGAAAKFDKKHGGIFSKKTSK